MSAKENAPLGSKGALNTTFDANYNTSSHQHSAIDQFRQAMQMAGIYFSGEIIADGRLHRFHIEGQKMGTKNGAYILHLDDHPAGWFLNYTTGQSQNWRGSGRAQLSNSNIQQIREVKRQREEEIRLMNEDTAKKAKYIWSQSKPIARRENHKYLVTKGIQQHGARVYRESLVIPIYNESDQLVNLQFISAEGKKLFLSGGRKRGCFHILGDLTQKILICEGFATGASLFEDQGRRVIVAFDAGNLLPVALNIRELSPNAEIIICGDNDPSGIGQIKAKEAALAICGKFIIPPIPGQDWNDYLTGGRQYA